MAAITIKRDIKTPDANGVWGYNGAKTKEEIYDFDGLRDAMAHFRYEGLHELLVGERYRPYADVEKEVELSKEDFEKEEFRVLYAAQKAMERLFPDGNVVFFRSSSWKKGKISGHFIMNDIFYTSKAQIRYVLEKGCDMNALHMDTQVYDKNKTMRLPLCSKPGQKRPLKYAELKSIGDAQFIQAQDEDEEADLNSGLITYVQADEKEMPVPEGFVEDEKDREEKCDAYGKYDRAPLTLEKIQKLVAAVSDDRVIERANRRVGIMCIRQLADYQKMDLHEVAHEWAKKAGDKYDQGKVESLYNNPGRHPFTFNCIIGWAKRDCPNVEATLTFPVGEEFDIEVLKTQMQLVKTEADLVEFSDATVDYINNFYTLVKWGRKPFIIWETVRINKDGEREKLLDYKDVHSMSIDFMNKKIPYKLEEAKKFSFFDPLKCWLSHRKRNEKDRICFNPKAMLGPKYVDPRAYNLFDGYAIAHTMCKDAEPLSADGPWLQHVLKRWACDNVELYNNVLDRFALQIQKPWVKHGVALGLMSPEGSGKGLVLQPIFEIIGKKYIAIPSNSGQVLGQFNSMLEGKLMVFLDELTWGGDKEREGAMKKLITEETIGLERKGIDAVTIDNPSNVVCCSNDDWIVAASKRARRFELLKLSTELAGRQTKETAAIIQAILDTPILSIAKFFYERDISNFNPKIIIATDALRSQKIESMSPLDAKCLSMLNRGQVQINGLDQIISNESFPKTEFYDSVGAGLKYMTDTKFWLRIRELWPSVTFDRPTVNKKRIQMVVFPEMKVLRKEWCTMFDDADWKFDEADEYSDE